MPTEPPQQQQQAQPQPRDGAVRENRKQLPEPKKEKVRPPSPPSVIRDQKNTLVFTKVGFLGEGGFARVYEAKDAKKVRKAIKVISKDALKTAKTKTKLFAEIKIHRSLNHPNIVRFEECFEDEENVYMVLELCEGGSLVDLIRRRKRLTEPEARVLLIQLIGASEWMHTHQVIHRDLKLGNIFLDGEMNVKVGDFGLAALIENPGDRKKTVCGTPNYIAPEVLFDPGNGHSFEVDIWSIGVILYTLVVGKPPFQNKEIKAIYKRIRDNLYEFPPDIPISNDCKSLISAMLTKDPAQRPSLREVLEHPFLIEGLVPSSIPSSAHDIAPSWKGLTPTSSRQNLLNLREAAHLNEEPDAGDESPNSAQAAASSSPNLAASSVVQQERDFQKAIQPGSPISVLLQSANQPFLMVHRDNESLIKKLTATRERETGELLNKRGPVALKSIKEGKELDKEGTKAVKIPLIEPGKVTTVENQKARIVAQMTANFPTISPAVTDDEGKGKVVKRSSNLLQSSSSGRNVPLRSSGLKASTIAPEQPTKLNAFNVAELTLVAAFDAMARNVPVQPPDDLPKLPELPNFLICWVDYSSKYGMGYAMRDGTIAAHFNDSTSLIGSPNEKHLEYIVRRGKSGSTFIRKHYEASKRPDDLADKTRLLSHFSTYLMKKLYGDHEYTFVDAERTAGMDFVQKYLRLKHAILFKLSNDVLQFNFYDHSKVIISHRGHVLTYIAKEDELKQCFLGDIFAETDDEEEKKTREKLLVKLKYCRQVFREIRKGEVVLLKPSTNTTTNVSTPAPATDSGSAINGDPVPAMADLRVEDIGRRKFPTGSSKLLSSQAR